MSFPLRLVKTLSGFPMSDSWFWICAEQKKIAEYINVAISRYYSSFSLIMSIRTLWPPVLVSEFFFFFCSWMDLCMLLSLFLHLFMSVIFRHPEHWSGDMSVIFPALFNSLMSSANGLIIYLLSYKYLWDLQYYIAGA